MAELRTQSLRALRWTGLALTGLAITLLVIWSARQSRQQTAFDAGHLKENEAMAFVLGWQSKMVLAQNTSDKPMRLYLIGLYTEKLGVRLPHPLEYYLSDAERDQGARAQAFAEEALKQLGTRRTIANHFGIASNILLTISRSGAKNRDEGAKADLERLASALDVPANLKLVSTLAQGGGNSCHPDNTPFLRAAKPFYLSPQQSIIV